MKTTCPKCQLVFEAKNNSETSRCRSSLFKGFTFTLGSGTLRAKSENSKCDIQLKTGNLAGDYFTILNFYTKTVSGNAWIEEHYSDEIQEEFWNDINWLISIVEMLENKGTY